jgi:hypothetical protein
MNQPIVAALAACVFAAALVTTAQADFAVIELPDLVEQSDLIVVGTITAIARAEPSRTATDMATITVEQVLLGTAGKTVTLGFPGERIWVGPDGRTSHFEASTWIRYTMSQDGIWLLKWDKDANCYRAEHPARFQPREKLDKVKAAIAEAEAAQAARARKPAPPTLEERAMIECWIVEKDLNQYGDPKDTAYTGGTPLFDEASGTQTDRFDYILARHAGLLRELYARYAPRGPQPPPVPVEWRERIDAWLRAKGLNRYGDPEGTTYPNWSPLFDEEGKVLRERYRYLLEKFPDLQAELEADEG